MNRRNGVFVADKCSYFEQFDLRLFKSRTHAIIMIVLANKKDIVDSFGHIWVTCHCDLLMMSLKAK